MMECRSPVRPLKVGNLMDDRAVVKYIADNRKNGSQILGRIKNSVPVVGV